MTAGDVRRAARAAWRTSSAERFDLLRVVAAAIVVEAGLRLFSLSEIARRLGIELRDDAEPSARSVPDLAPCEVRVLQAVERVFRRWRVDGPCLRRSLVCGYLLRARRPVLRMGVARTDGALAAHAWIEIGGSPVLEAGEPRERYRVLENAVRA